MLASGEACVAAPLRGAGQAALAGEVGYNCGRPGNARLPYLAVSPQFLRLTDWDRWKAAFPLAANCGGKPHTCKYLEDVMRAEGLERQCMDILARLAL